jgi:hypothetical protein
MPCSRTYWHLTRSCRQLMLMTASCQVVKSLELIAETLEPGAKPLGYQHFTRLFSAFQQPDFPTICGSSWSLDVFKRFRAIFPMDHTISSQRPRKRRAINACVTCRTSKVRCDGKRPCQRCDRNDAVCQYHEVVRDENILRIERLEAEVASLRHEMNNISDHQDLVPTQVSSSNHAERHMSSNAIDTGLITWDQAVSWYQRYGTNRSHIGRQS